MTATPIEAWQRFLKFFETPEELFSHSPDELMALLDAFLENPNRHREYVRLISGAAGLIGVARVLPGLRLLMRLGLFRWRHDLLKNLQNLREQLLSDVEPGTVGFDILPTVLLPQPRGWEADMQLHELNVIVAVNSANAFPPESFSLRLHIGGSASVRFVDCWPSTELVDVGKSELAVTFEGRYVRSSSAALGGKAGIEKYGASMSAGLRAEQSSERTRTERTASTIEIPTTLPKVISSAVERTAQWQLLATPHQPLIGGLNFGATMIVAGRPTSLPAIVDLRLMLTDWGPFAIQKSSVIEVSVGEPRK